MAEAPDRAALEQLLADSRPRLEMWVAARLGRLLKARLEVEDIVQEILLKAYEALPSFTPHGERAFFGWLFTIAEHRIADLGQMHSAQKRHPARERELHSRFAADQTTPSMAAARTESHGYVLDAMAGLSDRYRQILRLRRIEMLSNEEAGRRMEITGKNASVLYARALEALRKKLEEGGATDSRL